jgi:hypothetical protein
VLRRGCSVRANNRWPGARRGFSPKERSCDQKRDKHAHMKGTRMADPNYLICRGGARSSTEPERSLWNIWFRAKHDRKESPGRSGFRSPAAALDSEGVRTSLPSGAGGRRRLMRRMPHRKHFHQGDMWDQLRSNILEATAAIHFDPAYFATDFCD